MIASIMSPEIGGSYQGWSPCIEWCKENCESRWIYVGEGVFDFVLDSDYTMFMLRWS